ncbi:MAG: DUF2085 domain-containing protein [Clostridium sp.]|uniref:DUF2085 domain-containing protein n=1 Tax=Clostridium sp. TaxID=1506 RepID=UPI003F2BA90C
MYKWLPRIFGCHCRDDRSFIFKNRKFPICARCTGELIGIIISCIFYKVFKLNIIIDIIIMIPMIIDGIIQLKTKYESNNFKRVITGILFGIGLSNLFIKSIVYIYMLGYHYRK